MTTRSSLQIATASALLLGTVSTANATITTFLSSGKTCDGAASTHVGGVGQSVFVSVCATTTTESLCGHTLRLMPGDPADANKFVIKSRTLGRPFTEATVPHMVFPVAIPQADGANTDLGGIAAAPAPAGPKQLLATFEIRSAGASAKPVYELKIDNRASLAVSTNGKCDETAAEAPLRATFSISRD